MSEQPPRASGHLPGPGEAEHRHLDPDPEAPPMAADRPDAPEPEARLRDTAGYRLDQAADAARRLGHRVREQGGLAGRAEPIAYRVGDSLQGAASYVRENDVRRMREDVETGVREAPIKSLAIAAVAGFVIGRMIR